VVTIARDVQASLDVEFSQAQNFSGFTLDAALDKLLLISQQNKSYALQRNLSYVINSYLPESLIEASVQIPVLPPGNVWLGATGGGVIAAFLQQPADVSTLRSELANNAPVTDGATLVGYYDSVNDDATTVDAQLTFLTEEIIAPFPPGTVIDFAGLTPPAGFILADGTSYPTSTYPNLFAAIGYSWGGSGANFNVPKLQRAVTIGAGGTGTAIIGNEVGDTFDGETTSLTSATQLPAHSHAATTTADVKTGNAIGQPVTTLVAASFNTPTVINYPGTITTTIGNTGNGDPFNIIQTSAVVLKCIKT
jgi:microcystin-dependent protein